VLQVSTLVKQMKKKLPNSSIFFGFYGWFDKMRTPRTCYAISVSQIALSSPRLNCETLKSAAEGLCGEFTCEAKSRNKHTTKNKPKAVLTSLVSAYD
jgi:hypothetical protein